ncbi:MAG: hypothetical protein ACFFCW_44510 [Candidatus Hodarchaeota archaeon]
MNGTYAKDPPSPAIDLTQISFYDLIKSVCKGPNPMPLHRVCTLMRKMNAKWLVEESLEETSELSKEFAAVRKRCGKNTDCKATRLSFFADVGKGDWRHQDCRKGILAYVVLITLGFPEEHFAVRVGSKTINIKDKTYIYEAVVAFPAKHKKQRDGTIAKVPITNYYYHCGNTFTTVIGTKNDYVRFKLSGTYFAQQNSLTSVCAHACIQMAINNSPVLTQKKRRRKLTSERINKILRIDHQNPQKQVGKFERDPKKTSTKGLSNEQIQELAKKLNIGILKMDFRYHPEVDASRWIYPTLESSCPTILGIQRPPIGTTDWFSHVVTVLGHTMNTDSWGPEAKSGYQQLTSSYYHSTSEWVDHFLMADDNFGIYRTLPTNELHHIILPQFNADIHPSMGISFVPQEVTGRPIEAEFAAFIYLAKAFVPSALQRFPNLKRLKWFNELLQTNTFNEKIKTKITCRTFWSSANQYVQHLATQKDRNQNRLDRQTIKKIASSLPELVWITEVSLPDILCGNKAKLGDILTSIDFTYERYPDLKKIIRAVKFAWLPGVGAIGKSSILISWPFTSYIPLQRSALAAKHPQMEW